MQLWKYALLCMHNLTYACSGIKNFKYVHKLHINIHSSNMHYTYLCLKAHNNS